MTDNATILSQKIAEFIVKAEFDRQNVSNEKEVDIYQKFHEKNEEVNQHLEALSSEVGYVKQVMSHVGVSQWRQATEKLLHDTKSEMLALTDLYHQTHDAISLQCEQLNRSSMTTIKNVSQLITSVKHNKLEKLTEEKSIELQADCEKSLSGVEKVIRSFHWKNLVMALILSLVVSTIVSLFINDEWPWQAHDQVVKQRQAGKALLSLTDKEPTNDSQRA